MTVADLIERLVRIPDWSMLVGISDNDGTILADNVLDDPVALDFRHADPDDDASDL